MMKTMRIAAIPGDGIGKEVLPEGIRVLQAAAERWGFALSFEQMEWASWEYYSHHGRLAGYRSGPYFVVGFAAEISS